MLCLAFTFFFSSRRRHTRSYGDWSSDVCSSDLLSFTTDLPTSVKRSVIVFIAVGTPPKTDGRTDLSAVEAVAQEIGRAMDRYTVVVNKSTVPVGTGEFVREVIEPHQRQPVSFRLVTYPAFLYEGSAS